MSDGRIIFDTAVNNSEAEKDISELQKYISDVVKNVEDSTVKSSKQLQQTVSSACDKIASEAKELPSVMKEAATESEEAAENAATKSSDSATEAGKKIRKESDRTKESVEDDAEGMGNAHKKHAKNAESKWSAAFSKIKKGMQTCANVGKTALKAVGIAAAAVVTVATLGVNYNNQMEAYNTSFKTMLGSAEAAYDMVADLKELAAETPLEMSDLASNAQTMLSFGISDDKTLTYLKQIGDVSQGDADKFSSLTLAFSQIQSAGKLTGQDLLQLINAGFNPLQILSEKTGKSMATLKEEMSKGKISAEMVADAFKIATSEGGLFFGAMEAQSKTFSGRMSTLKDNALSFLGELTEGIQNELKDTLLPTVTGYLDQLQSAYTSGGLEALSEATGDVLANAATEIASNAPILIDTAVSVVTSFAQSLGRNSDKVAAAATKIVKSLVNGLVKLVPEVEKAASKILSALIGEIFGAKAGNAVKKLTDSVRKSLDLIFKTVKKVIGWLKPVVRNVLSTIANMTKSTIPALTVALKALEPVLWLVCKAFEGVSWIIDKFSEGIDTAIGWFGKFLGVSSDTAEEIDSLGESIRAASDTWAEMETAAADSLSSTLVESATLEHLKNKLNNLVDENGNLKGSEEDLLGVIERLKTYGFDVEYDAVKKQIDGYKNLQSEIQNTINLKKYEAYANATQEMYIDAITQKAQATQNAADALEEMHRLERIGETDSEEYTKAVDKYNEALSNLGKTASTINTVDGAAGLMASSDMEGAIAMYEQFYDGLVVVGEDGKTRVDQTLTELVNDAHNQLSLYKELLSSGSTDSAELTLGEFDALLVQFTEMGASIPQGFSEAIKNGSMSVDDAISILELTTKEKISQLDTSFIENNEVFAQNLRTKAIDALNNYELLMRNGFTDSAQPYLDEFESLITKLNQTGAQFPSDLATQIRNGNIEVQEAFKYLLSGIGTASLSSKEVGTAVVNDFIAPIKAGKEEAQTAGQSLLTSTIQGMDGIADFGSPSKTMHKYGAWTVEGYTLGIEENTPLVDNAASEMASSVISNIKSADFKSVGSDSMLGLLVGMNSKRGLLLSAARSIALQITATLRKAFDSHSPSRKTKAIGIDVGDGLDIGLKHSLKNAASTAYDQAAKLVDKMRNAVISRRTALAESVIGNTTNNTNTTNNYDERSFNQSFNFYSPNPTPSQTARAARLALEVT